MSMLSIQIAELREKARLFEGYQGGEISRMLREAADTIEGLRDRLQDAVLRSGTCENASELNTDGLAGYYFTCSECGLSICASMGIGEIELSNPRSFHWKADGEYEFERCPRCGKKVKR